MGENICQVSSLITSRNARYVDNEQVCNNKMEYRRERITIWQECALSREYDDGSTHNKQATRSKARFVAPFQKL